MIYVNFEIPKTVEEFLTKFFSNSKTYNDYLTNVETFSDPECTTIQCHSGKYRSFEEVLECVNTYYDELKPKDLMLILDSLVLKHPNGTKRMLYTLFCETICKPVMLFAHDYKTICDSDKKGIAKHSWEELFNMIKK